MNSWKGFGDSLGILGIFEGMNGSTLGLGWVFGVGG